MIENNIDVDWYIETSWEVCNKVGGIYTVLSTKAKTLQKTHKDKVIFIGPDVWSSENPSPFFVESQSIFKTWRNNVNLPHNISVRIGRWDIPGKPIAILIKFGGMYAVKDEFYSEMWNKFGVDSLHAYGDYDEACAFSHAAGIVIESLYSHIATPDQNVIAHFDEWTTGMGLLFTKTRLPKVATIFTTHATSIGRSICGNGKPLYDYLEEYNGDQMAAELNMQSKHSLEKTAAIQADCFTTVSQITAIECQQLIGRRPDVVTPNGFEPNFVPAKTKFKMCRHAARTTLFDVASALTGKQYNDDTFILCTSGRCEYRNKGIDVFLDSLVQLSNTTPSRNVLAFVMVPAWCAGGRKDLEESLINSNTSRLYDAVITHGLHNYDYDAIINRIHQIGFTNDASSKVDVIYVPCYLNGNDGIFNMSYYQLLIGMDATVFPSYYEPWGYTPLESIAFGVPTITTSLSGFGQWILQDFTNNFDDCGVMVINRNDSNYSSVVEDIANSLKALTDCNKDELANISKSAFSTSAKAAWPLFITYYYEAINIALRNKSIRNS